MLTSSDLATLRKSALVLRDVRDATAGAFYSDLFRREPDLRRLFPEEISDQERKFVATLAVIVNSMNDWESLKPVVDALARRHVTFGVRVEHYAVVGAVLLDTLRRLGAPEDDVAVWKKVYGLLADHMIATAYPA